MNFQAGYEDVECCLSRDVKDQTVLKFRGSYNKGLISSVP